MSELDRFITHLEHLARIDRLCWWRRHPFLTPWPQATVDYHDPVTVPPTPGAPPSPTSTPGVGRMVPGSQPVPTARDRVPRAPHP